MPPGWVGAPGHLQRAGLLPSIHLSVHLSPDWGPEPVFRGSALHPTALSSQDRGPSGRISGHPEPVGGGPTGAVPDIARSSPTLLAGCILPVNCTREPREPRESTAPAAGTISLLNLKTKAESHPTWPPTSPFPPAPGFQAAPWSISATRPSPQNLAVPTPMQCRARPLTCSPGCHRAVWGDSLVRLYIRQIWGHTMSDHRA